MARCWAKAAMAAGLTAAVLGCGSDDGGKSGDSGAGADAAGNDANDASDGSAAAPGTATFQARGSVLQVFVTHASAGEALVLRDAAGADVASGTADALGSLVFRMVPAGDGYRVHGGSARAATYSDAVRVWGIAESQPPASFYQGQVIKAGYGYLTMRDGTTLAYFATLPGPVEDGPYPTVVNYSGYSPAKPGEPIVGPDQRFYCDALPVLCNAPSDVSSMLAAVAGYASVSVNMRGTGCSGGAYDYFETLQLLDGYDVVETVAAQPWVKHHKVGMVGLSYPGITQLFVAKMQPPGLAAIAPMSVIGSSATTLVPGGILNNGFAINWIDNVFSRAAPYGQGWEQARVDGGDTVCAENQLLHGQRVNNVEQAKDPKYYTPEVIDPLDPSLWADAITVPLLLTGSFQDEQTGPYFTTLFKKLQGVKGRRFLLTNGVHSDGLAPQLLAEWKAFLDLYVARVKPTVGGTLALLAEQFTKTVFGDAVKLPADRWTKLADHAAALAQWESELPMQVYFESGAGDKPGLPVASFVHSFASWPPPETKARRYYLAADGDLADAAPATATAVRFRLDPTAGERGILGKGTGLWKALPTYDWKAPKAGDVVAFATPPLGEDVVMVGTGSVDLYLRSTATGVDDADLEVNLTELRPDGQEIYVQSGWLRASFRKLTKASTELWPEPSLRMTDVEALPVGPWVQVRVAIAGFSHVFRKGSQIRVAVDTPGDSRADWRFDLKKFPGEVRYDVGIGGAHASSVALPALVGVVAPASATLPPCPSLRGQPCRKTTTPINAKTAP